jgi:hypothetical protein
MTLWEPIPNYGANFLATSMQVYLMVLIVIVIVIPDPKSRDGRSDELCGFLCSVYEVLEFICTGVCKNCANSDKCDPILIRWRVGMVSLELFGRNRVFPCLKSLASVVTTKPAISGQQNRPLRFTPGQSLFVHAEN